MIPPNKIGKLRKDITDQFTPVNCTLDSGKAFLDEQKKIVYVALAITPKTTSGWQTVMQLPKTLKSIDVTAQRGGGMNIIGSDMWIDALSEKALIKGATKANEQIGIYGFYFID